MDSGISRKRVATPQSTNIPKSSLDSLSDDQLQVYLHIERLYISLGSQAVKPRKRTVEEFDDSDDEDIDWSFTPIVTKCAVRSSNLGTTGGVQASAKTDILQNRNIHTESGHLLKGHHVLIVSGPAGTGKSYLVKSIFREILDKHATKPLLLTPTNGAASFIDGITIDKYLSSLLQTNSVALYQGMEAWAVSTCLGGKNFTSWPELIVLIRNEMRRKLHNTFKMDTSNFVAIDEMSMVPLMKLVMLAAVLAKDCVFLLLGDACQLPPVVDYRRQAFDNKQTTARLQSLHAGEVKTIDRNDRGARHALLETNVYGTQCQLLLANSHNAKWFHLQKNMRFRNDSSGLLYAHGASLRHCILNDWSIVDMDRLHLSGFFVEMISRHAACHTRAEFEKLPHPKIILSATIEKVLEQEEKLLQDYIVKNGEAPLICVCAAFGLEVTQSNDRHQHPSSFRNQQATFEAETRWFRPAQLLRKKCVRRDFRKYFRQDSALHLATGIPVVVTMTANSSNALPDGIFNGLVGKFLGTRNKRDCPELGDALMIQCGSNTFAVPSVLTTFGVRKEGYKFNQLTNTIFGNWHQTLDRPIYRQNVVSLSLKQYPILPLLASTVHGIQGSTIGFPVLVDGTNMTKRHYYVSTTRVEHACNLYIDNLFVNRRNAKGELTSHVSQSSDAWGVWRQAGVNFISKEGYTTNDDDIKQLLSTVII